MRRARPGLVHEHRAGQSLGSGAPPAPTHLVRWQRGKARLASSEHHASQVLEPCPGVRGDLDCESCSRMWTRWRESSAGQ